MLLGPDGIVHSVLAGPDVGFGGLDKRLALDDLPGKVEDYEDVDVDIGDDEVVRAPVDLGVGEDGKAVEEDDDGEVNKREPGSVWLELALEDERAAVNPLGKQRRAETQVRNENGHR